MRYEHYTTIDKEENVGLIIDTVDKVRWYVRNGTLSHPYSFLDPRNLGYYELITTFDDWDYIKELKLKSLIGA